MQQKSLSRQATGAVSALLLGLSLVACSSSTGTNATMSEAEVDACLEEAQSIVEEAQKPFEQELPEPIDGSSASGESFWVISVTQAAPSVVAQTEGFESAAESVGAEAVVFDGKGSPDLFNQGVNSAVAAGAAGILLLGFEPSLVKNALKGAADADIPVVHALGGVPDADLLPGVVSTSTFDARKEGEMQAAYAALKTDCQVNGVMFYSEASAATALIGEGARDELERLCAESCSLDLQNVEAATFATELTPQTQNVLQRSPDINFILTSSDSYVAYILAATKALGKDVPVVGATGVALAAAQEGSGQTADVLWPPLKMCGYLNFDAVLRATLGQSDTVEYGLRLVDQSNWGDDASDETQYPELTGFEETFTQDIWGIS